MRQVEPQLSELLRTCIYPPSLFLQVKHIKRVDLKHDADDQSDQDRRQDFDGLHRYAAKLLLGDSELMIQALLHRKISTLADVADLDVGDFVDCRRFTIKRSKRLNGMGTVVYLAIEDCTFIKVPKDEDHGEAATPTQQQSAGKRKRQQMDSFSFDNMSEYESAAEEMIQQSPTKKTKRIKFAEDGALGAESAEPERTRSQATPSKRRSALPPSWTKPVSEEEEEEDFVFSTQESNPAASSKRRLALRELDQNVMNVARSQIRRPDEPTKPSDEADKPVDTEELSKPDELSHIDVHPQTPHKAQDQVDEDNNWMPTPLPRTHDRRDHAHWVYPRHPEGAFSLSQIQPSARPQLVPPVLPRAKTQPEIDKKQDSVVVVQKRVYPPPPFHTLRSLRDPPVGQPLPTKSYTFTTLAVITWTGTSLIHRHGSVFPPKRHLKVMDASFTFPESTTSTTTAAATQEQNVPSQPHSTTNSPPPSPSNRPFRPENPFQEAVTVAIYIDAATFRPLPGTIALFRGLVMQRLANGDIILNAYGRLKDMRFQGDKEEEEEDEQRRQLGVTKGEEDGLDNMDMDTDTHWFITNPDRIRRLGHAAQLARLQLWWEKQRRR